MTIQITNATLGPDKNYIPINLVSSHTNLEQLTNLVEEKLHCLYMAALDCFVERGSTSAVLAGWEGFLKRVV